MVPWLSPDPHAPFPDPALCQRHDGLVAAGGDLSTPRLLAAYRHGLFPWFSEGDPLLWWSPEPRCLFRTDGVRLPSKFRRALGRSDWTVHADTAFADVIDACARQPRPGQRGTWITAGMREAYLRLHAAGHAHSIEVRDGGGRLVGGLYGVAIGRMVFGESMVSLASGGSKVALAALAHRMQGWGWPLLDAQLENPHLRFLGAELWPRRRFLAALPALVDAPDASPPGPWTHAFGVLPAAALAVAPATPAPGA